MIRPPMLDGSDWEPYSEPHGFRVAWLLFLDALPLLAIVALVVAGVVVGLHGGDSGPSPAGDYGGAGPFASR